MHTLKHAKKPKWLRKKLPRGPVYEDVRRMLNKGQLHTVCQEAKCPNIWECFSRRTATFLILGNRCTRNCRFCAVEHGHPMPPDPEEPKRVAVAAKQLGLEYVVVTSVTRDDLPDGGAGLFAETILEIRRQIPHAKVEVLIPDFKGDDKALATVLKARPDVLNHNIETVSRLYDLARPGADYFRSLRLLKKVTTTFPDIPTKSGIMLGLGETGEEIDQTLRDIHATGCKIVTIGQYLQPSLDHLPVALYVPPEEFEYWKGRALEIGFVEVMSGPFVRSSYHAREMYQTLLEAAP
ncbi:MAG: lipoyl synthase [Deltaproteobacteria bacterium]|nr:MAG: lipoyl synthase [Deltaproteobacteria bacterium]